MKICSECNAVFDGRKWNSSPHLSRKEVEKLSKTLCTACKRIRDGVALGTVYLDGDIITSRSSEIIRMIQREEEIERARNHSSRILDIKRDGNRMTIRTVNSSLAIHIARQFSKAFKGRIEIFKDTPGHMPRNKQTEGTVSVKWMQNP
jgi:NMD protein affecting ribosome stability and mRNA decay